MKTAIITTAGNMSQATYQALCDGLTRRFGQLNFEHRQDADVLGGFLVDLNGIVYDNTVKTRLEQMRRHLEET